MTKTNIHRPILLLIILFMAIIAYVQLSIIFSRAEWEVSSHPPGAKIYIENELMGETPKRIDDIDIGGTRELKLEKEGFATCTRLVPVKARDQRNFHIYLSDLSIETGPTFETIAVTSRGFSTNSNLLFLPTSTGTLFALDKETKETIWAAKMDKHILITPPTIKEETIFQQTFSGPIYALDRNTGNILWVSEGVKERTTDLEPTGDGLMTMTFRGQILFIDYEGNLVWETDRLDPLLENTLHIQNEQGRALNQSGEILSIFFDDGQQQKIFSPGEEINLIKAAQNSSFIAGLSEQSNLLLWDKQNEEYAYKELHITTPDRVFLAEDLVLITSTQGKIVALNTDDLQQTWEKELPYPLTSSAYNNQYIFMGSSNGSVFILNRENGEVISKRALPVTTAISCIYADQDPSIIHVSNKGGLIKTYYLPTF